VQELPYHHAKRLQHVRLLAEHSQASSMLRNLPTKHCPKAIWLTTAHEHACPLSSAIIITWKASKLTSEPSARESQQQLLVDARNR
jgi:hypothetical protein